MRLVGRIALFEIGRQIRQPLFGVASLLLFALTVTLMSSHGVLGSGVLMRNAPPELAKAAVLLSIFYLAVIVAMAGDAALRDARSGFEPLLRATPVRRIEHLLGRLIGAQVAANLAFLIGLSGLVAGAFAPWIDQSAVGPFNWPQTLWVVVLVAVPTVAALTSLCFALAAGLRSVTAVYVVVIVLWAVVLQTASLIDHLHGWTFRIAALLEPFGLIALRTDLSDLDPTIQARVAVQADGLLVLNRLVWAGLSSGLVVLSLVFERRFDASRLRRAPGGVSAAPVLAAWPRTTPRFDVRAGLAQFRARLFWELRMLFRSPSLLILIALSAVMSGFSLWHAGSVNLVPALPATRILAADLNGWFTTMGLIICTFYAGELVWRDRDHQASELIDVTPVPDAILMTAKVVALGVAVLLLGLAGMGSALGVQLAKGYFDGGVDLYLRMMVLPVGGSLMVLAIGSVALAALAANRYAAWGVAALVIGGAFAASAYGVGHPLLILLAGPSNPLSEMNAAGDGTHADAWTTLYWLLAMSLLLLAAWLVWPRGRPAPWRARRAQAVRRLRGAGGWVASGLAAALVATGGFVFLNVNVWNSYSTDRQVEAAQADWERAVTPSIGLPEPVVVSVKMRVELEPRRPGMAAKGTYLLENRTGQALNVIHVSLPNGLDDWTLEIDGAHQVSADYGLVVLRLDRPMAPGERRWLRFETKIAPHGFGQNGGQTDIVDNGTFLRSWDIAPTLGVSTAGFLTAADARRRQHLPPQPAALEPTDPRAARVGVLHADWADLDVTVVTDADQTPIAPGRQVSDSTANGRRTARFVSDQPMLNAFSIQSARYAVRRAQHGKVAIAVYYHPGHGTNIDRMIKALKGGLDVYQAEYGPYQFDYLRIVEFPAYGDYAQSFAGTIPFSENIGFVADVRGARAYDYVTAVTLHELAHQWWAHQVIGADAKGARLLSEGLAEYSAFMAQNRLQGRDMANDGLLTEFKLYKEGVAGRTGPQQSLVQVTDQNYIAYYRAALVLEACRQLMGEAALHAALRDLLHTYRFKGAPYATSEDLLKALHRHASAEAWAQIEPLFRETRDHVVIYFYGGFDKKTKARMKAGAPDVNLVEDTDEAAEPPAKTSVRPASPAPRSTRPTAPR